MLTCLLDIPNLYWAGECFSAPLDAADAPDLAETLQGLRGQFSLAMADSRDGTVRLTRDRLGSNKLFFAVRETGEVICANHLVKLVSRGVPIDAVFSVPPGHIVEINASEKRLSLTRYFQLDVTAEPNGQTLESYSTAIKHELETWFDRMATAFKDRTVCVCLSGGLDSGLIAALSKQHFRHLRLYTYGYVQDSSRLSEDVSYAWQLAKFLQTPLRFVPATADDVFRVIERALIDGQDWRDFNVHCAIVNELLAEAICRDAQDWGESRSPLVLTGDLMNEFLSDYSPVTYRGQQYYPLPRLTAHELRTALIRGLDAGDREVGVFGCHGIALMQPYGLLTERYCGLPTSLICRDGGKQCLVKAVGRDVLPEWILKRKKVRAQIGTEQEPSGILPVLVEAGCTTKWLSEKFCQLLGVKEYTSLNSLIRRGQYRYLTQFPDGEPRNEYLTGRNSRSH